MNRRGFLGAILATACAPAIVRGGILMPVRQIALPTDEEVFAVSATYGNTLLSPEIIARRALQILSANLALSRTWTPGLPLATGDRITIHKASRVTL